MYAEAHKQIRENPVQKKKEHSAEDLNGFKSASKEHYKPKLTYDQRKERVQEKISQYKAGELEA